MHIYNFISKQAPQECSKNKSQQNCNEFVDWKDYFLENFYVYEEEFMLLLNFNGV